MKEELIRVLNNKLDDINGDIDSLVELNSKISDEEEKLSFVNEILDLFEKDSENKVNSFVKINKINFNKILDILGDDVRETFNSDSCNYDGLVYLINGINSGVSLTLTDEQKNAILYLIHGLEEKQEEHNASIDGFKLVKNRYEISDVQQLKNKKEKYLKILDDLNNEKYVNDTDLLTESIDFSELSEEKTIDILKYVLKYNADIYNRGENFVDEKDESVKVEENLTDNTKLDNETNMEQHEDIISFDNISSNKEYEPFTAIDEKDYQEFHFDNINKDEIVSFSPVFSSDNIEDNAEENFSDDSNVDTKEEDADEYQLNVDIPSEYNQNSTLTLESSEQLVNENNVEFEDEDFDNNELFEYSGDKVSINDIQVLLYKYNVSVDNAYINELVTGDIKNYENILNALSENNLIDGFKNNYELLIEMLLYSDSEIVNNILRIIKNDLSVDDDDYVITTKIVINTIPSIFVDNGGNYDNFIQNIKTFKELDLNLINLFDFSKELFVATHAKIVENLEIVEKYDIKITYQNAKYLLLLPNIGDRLDYYVESIYEDKVKNEKFDGIEYIELYPAKLNVVTDETIKRLRYSSENGEKVFGNKPKSLVGEITNLKVNSLDISDNYYDKFFNNNFRTLTGDEVREYTKLIHNSSNVGNYDDELEFLNKYRDGIRYIIDNIVISYNKVVRNYSILRSYGIDNKKALDFAVCYNLVITKDEYDKLKDMLDELGGNK